MKIILLLSTDVGLVVHTYKFYDHVVGIQKFITFRLYNRNEFFFGVFFLRFFFFFVVAVSKQSKSHPQPTVGTAVVAAPWRKKNIFNLKTIFFIVFFFL